MANIIKRHDQKILNENDEASNEKKCNCTQKTVALDGASYQEKDFLRRYSFILSFESNPVTLYSTQYRAVRRLRPGVVFRRFCHYYSTED